MDRATVLVVDDEQDVRRAIVQSLSLTGDYDVRDFATGEELIRFVKHNLYGVAVTDFKMPRTDGLAVLRGVLDVDSSFPVVLITAHGDVPLAVESMRAGAYDFIEKPFAPSYLAAVVARALERRRLVLENRALREQLVGGDGIETRLVGASGQMEQLRRQIRALSDVSADVLVHGETGSGKDVVARAIHEGSDHRAGPFVAINSGAMPADMVESELFGHEQGAFTGASKTRVGKLEFANGGTVFLDEIESMPLALQVKLLRVIETRTIERLGSNKIIPLNIRFIAATKVDLLAACEAGLFRMDLYYRLNVVTLRIPSLRERKEDIPLLFHHLARQSRGRFRREIPDIPAELLSRLASYGWPGNVRELRNLVDRFVLGLPLGVEFPPVDGGVTALPPAVDRAGLVDKVALHERALIIAEIRRNNGNMTATAGALGVSRKTLYEKLRKYEIGRADVLASQAGPSVTFRERGNPEG